MTGTSVIYLQVVPVGREEFRSPPKALPVRVTESKIEKYLRESIEARGGECFKWVSPGRRGVPDRIVLMPSPDKFSICAPRVIFVELKSPTGRLRPEQIRMHARLRAIPFRVIVISTLEHVDEFLCSL